MTQTSRVPYEPGHRLQPVAAVDHCFMKDMLPMTTLIELFRVIVVNERMCEQANV